MAPRRCNAFTLIEILVVVVIVGIVSAIVMLSFGLVGDDRELQQDSRRLASLIDLAADEAVLQGRDFGLEFLESGYRFVEYDPYLDEWHEIAGDDLLRPRKLSQNLRFDLFVEARRVLLKKDPAKINTGDRDKRNVNSPRYAPHALLLSSGEVSPLHVDILRNTDKSKISVDLAASGVIEINASDDRIQ
jgi:general secretion pathway protein H